MHPLIHSKSSRKQKILLWKLLRKPNRYLKSTILPPGTDLRKTRTRTSQYTVDEMERELQKNFLTLLFSNLVGELPFTVPDSHRNVFINFFRDRFTPDYIRLMAQRMVEADIDVNDSLAGKAVGDKLSQEALQLSFKKLNSNEIKRFSGYMINLTNYYNPEQCKKLADGNTSSFDEFGVVLKMSPESARDHLNVLSTLSNIGADRSRKNIYLSQEDYKIGEEAYYNAYSVKFEKAPKKLQGKLEAFFSDNGSQTTPNRYDCRAVSFVYEILYEAPDNRQGTF